MSSTYSQGMYLHPGLYELETSNSMDPTDRSESNQARGEYACQSPLYEGECHLCGELNRF